MTKPATELLAALVRERGVIVTSADCSEAEIAFARVDGRFYVADDGIGYVLRTKEWLAARGPSPVEKLPTCCWCGKPQVVRPWSPVEEPRMLRAALDKAAPIAREAIKLLALMDEVDAKIGDETDRVFSRGEFAALRAVVEAVYTDWRGSVLIVEEVKPATVPPSPVEEELLAALEQIRDHSCELAHAIQVARGAIAHARAGIPLADRQSKE